MNKIETVVQDMMEKLGVGGFMVFRMSNRRCNCVWSGKEKHGKSIMESRKTEWKRVMASDGPGGTGQHPGKDTI